MQIRLRQIITASCLAAVVVFGTRAVAQAITLSPDLEQVAQVWIQQYPQANPDRIREIVQKNGGDNTKIAADYQKTYDTLASTFKDGTVNVNVLAKLAFEYLDDSTEAVKQVQQYQKMLTALQARYPDIATLALSQIAYQDRADASQAVSDVSSLLSIANNIQSKDGMTKIAAQIIASQNLGDLTNATLQANSLDSVAKTLASQLDVSETAATILGALDVTGELGKSASNTSDVLSLLNQAKSSAGSGVLSGLSSEAADILAATNIFTSGNMATDVTNVKNMASDLIGGKLSDSVKSVVGANLAQTLSALNLGSLSGVTSGSSTYSTIFNQVTNSTVDKAGAYKVLYDKVSEKIGSEGLTKIGANKAQEIILKNVDNGTSNPAKAEETVTKEADKEVARAEGRDPDATDPASSPSPTPEEGAATTDEDPDACADDDEECKRKKEEAEKTEANRKATYIKSSLQGVFATAIIDKLNLSGTAGSIASGYKAKLLAKNLILDGYRTYHIKSKRIGVGGFKSMTPSIGWGYTRYTDRRNDVDFSQATVPLLRNSNYEMKRLNSAETYYGYNARADVQTGGTDEMLRESSWLAKSAQPVKCMIKTSNLAYIVRTCDIAHAETCEALYLTADGAETIRGTKIKIHDLALAVTAILISDEGGDGELANAVGLALATGKGDLSSVMDKVNNVINKIGGDSDVVHKLEAMAADEIMEPLYDHRMPFCSSLYSVYSTASNEEQLALEVAKGKMEPLDIGRVYLRWAIEKLDFYLAKEYRTAYLVQVNKICPVNRQWLCSTPVYPPLYGGVFLSGCNAALTPDQVRVYPFKVPDLFTNKNFCNTSSLEYPGLALDDVSCEVSDKFSYTDMFQEYNDPAILHKNSILQTSQQKSYREKIVSKRISMAENASKACIATGLQRATNESDMTCTGNISPSKNIVNCQNCKGNEEKTALVKLVNSAIDKGDLYSIENPNGNSKGNDDIRDGLRSTSITTSAQNTLEAAMTDRQSFKDFCLWRIPGTFPPLFIPFFAYDDMDYYVIMPWSDEVEEIEKTVVSQKFEMSQYEQFLKDDKRQNRKINLNGIDAPVTDVPLWLPAGGPISNVFIQQESIYNTDQKLYYGFKNCSSVPSYFESQCAADESSPSEDYDEEVADRITQNESRCFQYCGSDDVEKIEYDDDGLGGLTCTCRTSTSSSDDGGTYKPPRHYPGVSRE